MWLRRQQKVTSVQGAAGKNLPCEVLVGYSTMVMETNVRVLGGYAGLAVTVDRVARKALFSADMPFNTCQL